METTQLICPQCGKPLNKYDWGWGCSGFHDGCKFAVGKICGKILTQKQMETLLGTGKVGPLSGFKSKAGKEFEASIVLKEEETPNGPMKMVKLDFGRPPIEDEPDVYARCPKCGGTIVKGPWGWECMNKCGVSVPYELCHRQISGEEAEALFSQGTTNVLEGFVSKKGSTFNASLKLNPDQSDRVQFVFPEKG